MATSVARIASTRWPPKSCAACSRCSLARRSEAMASRICGCGSGAAAGGWLDSARVAAAGTALPFGVAWLPTVKTNASTKTLAISKLMLFIFTDHSSSRNLAESPSSAFLNSCGRLACSATGIRSVCAGKGSNSWSTLFRTRRRAATSGTVVGSIVGWF
jgi:hypothetical protein